MAHHRHGLRRPDHRLRGQRLFQQSLFQQPGAYQIQDSCACYPLQQTYHSKPKLNRFWTYLYLAQAAREMTPSSSSAVTTGGKSQLPSCSTAMYPSGRTTSTALPPTPRPSKVMISAQGLCVLASAFTGTSILTMLLPVPTVSSGGDGFLLENKPVKQPTAEL